MKNLSLIIILLLIECNAFSQIGINTTNPQSQLDISASNSATPSNSDGILIPRISTFPITNPTVSQHGMMVFLTATSAGKQPGFYYWDNATTSWIGINSTINADTDWLKSSTGTTPNTTDDMYHSGKVAIGSTIHNGYTLSTTGTGINNTASINSSTGEVRAINNIANGNGSEWTFGEHTTVSGTNSGPSVGNFIRINNTNNFSEHDGIWIDMQNGNTTNNNRNGIRIDMSGTTTSGNWRVGLSNTISSDTSGYKAGVLNSMSGNGINSGVQNVFSTGTNGYGTNNRFIGSVPGIGMYNSMEATTSNSQYGMYNNYNGASTGINYGTYNIMSYGTGTEYGTYNDILNNTNGIKYGTYNRFLSTGTGAKYGTYNDYSGVINYQLYGSYTNINFTSGNFNFRVGNYVNITGNADGNIVGSGHNLAHSGNSQKVGVDNNFSGITTQQSMGFKNTFTSNDIATMGIHNTFNTTGAGIQYGGYSTFFGANNAQQYGIYNSFSVSSTGNATGMYNTISRNSTANVIGINNLLNAQGNGNYFGSNTSITDIGTGIHYGNYSDLRGTGAGNKYGYFSLIRDFAGGQHYGIYSEALKTGAFAGYFLGNVSIGTTTTNNYILPASKGTNGQTMQIDGTGTVNWVDPSLRNYASTGASTGIYNASLLEYTIRVYNGISEIRLPNAVGNTGKIFIIIGSNGISSKTFSTSGGYIYDDVTNSNISTINANERYSVQSDGTDWIVIGR